ncbi:Coatomer subunit beta' [Phlyctochytrium bullatum]|nr:Coatomer subunit beta' [Phlyctochytrium bullatum]
MILRSGLSDLLFRTTHLKVTRKESTVSITTTGAINPTSSVELTTRTVRIWHANTYRLENTLNYGMERVWAVAYLKGSNDIALGYDEGTIAIKLGREEPAVSMDNGGKIIWARHNEIRTANIKASVNVKDGERIALPAKELGSCEIFPQSLQHSPNGRFVVVCGDGEFIIYTALAWRNKEFGSALEFVWALDSNEYAIRESSSKVRVFKNFKEKPNVQIRPSYSAEGIYGGGLLGIRSNSFVNFYDWETGVCVRRVDVVPKNVYWSETDLVAIACEDTTYVLKFNRASFQQFLERNGTGSIGQEGIEEAFDFITEISEAVKSACWVGDCLIYTNSANRLNYMVGSNTSTLSHFDVNMYLLGYIPRDNRVFLADKDLNVFSYALPLSLIEYQTCILRGDVENAAKVLPSIPADQRNRVARFLEAQNMKEQALEVATDPDHRFDLAVQLGKLNIAYDIAKEVDREDKWKVVGDAALSEWKFDVATECLMKANDIEGLLLLYQASGNVKGLKELGAKASEKGKNNVAFLCYVLTGDLNKAVSLLASTDRLSEAALLSRTYMPSKVSDVVQSWKASLEALHKPKTAEAIADPKGYENLFPDFKYGLAVEGRLAQRKDKVVPAKEYNEWKGLLDSDLVSSRWFEAFRELTISALKAQFPDGAPEVPAISVKSVSVNGDEVPAVAPPAGEEERIPDNVSHLSMEVNTTGTGSLRGDVDFDDLASYTTDSVPVTEPKESEVEEPSL